MLSERVLENAPVHTVWPPSFRQMIFLFSPLFDSAEDYAGWPVTSEKERQQLLSDYLPRFCRSGSLSQLQGLTLITTRSSQTRVDR